MIELARELAGRRALIWALTRRSLIARYRGTGLGFLWSFLHPALTFAVYVLVFRVYVRIEVEGYAAFLCAGLLPWTWFAQAVAIGTTSILGDAPFVRQPTFSPALSPLVTCLATGVHFACGLPILLGVLLLLGAPLTPWLLLLPLLALVQLGLCYGVCLWTAPLTVRYRDLAQLVQAGLPLLFFLTPVVYPAEMVPAPWSRLLLLNPLAPLIGSYQRVLFSGLAPDPAGLAVAVVAALLLLASGSAVHARLRERIPEEL